MVQVYTFSEARKGSVFWRQANTGPPHDPLAMQNLGEDCWVLDLVITSQQQDFREDFSSAGIIVYKRQK
jgi:hypothetical protein